MLRLQDTATRERKSLNGLWRFAPDRAGDRRSGGWLPDRLPAAGDMAVPASFNEIAADDASS